MRLILVILIFCSSTVLSKYYEKKRFDRSVHGDSESPNAKNYDVKKEWTFTDYETHYRAYRDKKENFCYLKKLEDNGITENNPETEIQHRNQNSNIVVSNEDLTKLEAWRLAGGRIVDFCRGRKIVLLQHTMPSIKHIYDPFLNILPYDENDIVTRRVADIVLTPLINRAKRQIALEKRQKINEDFNQRRSRRQTHQSQGKFRGQTQSQYLNIGNDDTSQKEGKAEAEATQQSSHSVVTGSRGMGQAQSMSFGSLGCEDCSKYTSETGPDRYIQYPSSGTTYSRTSLPKTGGTGYLQDLTPSTLRKDGGISYPITGGVPYPGGISDTTLTGSGGAYPRGVPHTTKTEHTRVYPGGVPDTTKPRDSGVYPGTLTQVFHPGHVHGTKTSAARVSYPAGVPITTTGGGDVTYPEGVPGTSIPGGRAIYPGGVLDTSTTGGGDATYPGGVLGTSIPGSGATYPGDVPGTSRTGGGVTYPGGVPGTSITGGSATYPGGVPGTGITGGSATYPGSVPGTRVSAGSTTYPGGVPGGTSISGSDITYPGVVPGISTAGGGVTYPGGVPGTSIAGGGVTYPGDVPGTSRTGGGVTYPGGVPETNIAGGGVSYSGGVPGTSITNGGDVTYPGGVPTTSIAGGGVSYPGDVPHTNIPGGDIIHPGGVPETSRTGSGDVTYPGGVPGSGVTYPRGVPGTSITNGGVTYPGNIPGTGVADSSMTYPNGISGTRVTGGSATYPGAVPSTAVAGSRVPHSGRAPGEGAIYPGDVPNTLTATVSGTGTGGNGIYPGTIPGVKTTSGGVVYSEGTGSTMTGEKVETYPGGMVSGTKEQIHGQIGGTISTGIDTTNLYPSSLPGNGRSQTSPGIIKYPDGSMIQTVEAGKYPSGYPQQGQHPVHPQVQYPHQVPQGQYPSYLQEGQHLGYPQGQHPSYSPQGQYPGYPQQYPGYQQGQYPGIISWQNGRKPTEQYPSSEGQYQSKVGITGIGEPSQYYQQPGIPSTEDDTSDSQASSSVKQTDSGTQASASAQGKFGQGTAQSQVTGTYSGSGSFSAQAGSTDVNKSVQTEINGGKDGATSNAQGIGGYGKSQAQVQLDSESGATSTGAQSSGWNHGTNSQVQASSKGGMADAQANGEGSTSSQAQIGFQPYLQTDENVESHSKPFHGGGTASAQSGTHRGQSQSQLQGSFQYGITYTGAAQAGSGSGATASRKPFNFSLTDTELFKPFKPAYIPHIAKTNNSEATNTSDLDYEYNHDKSQQSLRTSSSSQKAIVVKPMDENSRNVGNKQSQSLDDTTYDYEEDYEAEEDDGEEHNNANHQSQTIRFTTGNQYDVRVKQDTNTARVGDTFQPGQSVSGYNIPHGFRGRVTSMAGSENFAQGDGKSQSQTVSLVPIELATHENKSPISEIRSLKTNRERLAESHILANEEQKDNFSRVPNRQSSADYSKSVTNVPMKPSYYTVTNSVAGKMDGSKNSPRKYEHRYYTKSSTCGYFTFSCNVVYGSNGRTKICKPKMPTYPDGTPMKC